MQFEPGTQVLAYHGPLIYSAKILHVYRKHGEEVEDSEGNTFSLPDKLPEHLRGEDAYLLHYKGWNPKWDEWVGPNRIMQVNEENLALQKELKQALQQKKSQQSQQSQQTSQQSKKKSSTSNSSNENKKNNLNNTNNNTNESNKQTKNTTTNSRKNTRRKLLNPELELSIPPRLKYILVDDWENITKSKLLVSLPAKISVKKILQDYMESKEINSVTNEIIQGLELYFNRSLSLILLYRFERLQYSNLLKQHGSEIRPSEIYGVEHLLRLFTALPGLIVQTTMDPLSIQVLMKECKEVLDYLDENIGHFNGNYINVDAGYQNLATQN